jgi:hypothetical protein
MPPPSYTFDDDGEVRHWLDDAQRRWPEVGSRRALFLRLARLGHHSLVEQELVGGSSQLREHQAKALRRLRDLADWPAIRDRQAWR